MVTTRRCAGGRRAPTALGGYTNTLKPTRSVYAGGKAATRFAVALVDVGAADTVARKSALACAREAAGGIGTGGVATAVVRAGCALVDVGA